MGEQEIEPQDRWRIALAIAEPILAFGLAVGLSLALSFPFLPSAGTDLEIRLRPRPDARGSALEPAEVVSRLRDLGIATRVEVEARSGGNFLVLYGAPGKLEAGPAIRDVLAEAGFQTEPLVEIPSFDLEALVIEDPKRLAAMLSVQAVVLLGLGIVLRRRRAPRLWAGATRHGPWHALLVGLAAGAAAVLASGLLSLVLSWMGWPVREQAWLEHLRADREALLLLLPWLLIVGPLAEEVFFRGYAFHVLRGRVGLPAALLVSSMLFASGHLNASGFLVYLVIGVGLAWSYERTGRLLAPIAGHFLVNGSALLLTVLLE